MKKYILKKIAKLIAKFYWGYLKEEINAYILNVHLKKIKKIGKNVIFKGKVTIYHPENIEIEDYVQIGDNIFLMGIGGISIGKGTIISRNVCIHSGNHDYKSNDILPFNDKYDKKRVVIGQGVWIGQNVEILPGIKIGDGAIIGMGTTISKNVKNGEIVVGKGQRTISNRDKNIINELIKENKFFGK